MDNDVFPSESRDSTSTVLSVSGLSKSFFGIEVLKDVSLHLNIEERSSAAAIISAGEHLVHVQVCGNDRGAPGGGQTDWTGILEALDTVGYEGPLNIESFTSHNASIAIAASIWRPLAESQDRLAHDGLAFLRSITPPRTATPLPQGDHR
ncbi:sugar phosphate isomerase/epimerase family protein [Arthrobacter sp. Sr33]